MSEMMPAFKTWALLFGVPLALVLLFISLRFASIFGVVPIPESNELFIMVIVLGFTFGYYLGLYSKETEETSVFAVAFITTMVVVYLAGFVLSILGIYASSIDLNSMIALALSTITGVSAVKSGIWKRREDVGKAISIFGGKVSWLLFGFHITYAYEIPVLTAFLSKISSLDFFTAFSFAILTIVVVAYFVIVLGYVHAKTLSE